MHLEFSDDPAKYDQYVKAKLKAKIQSKNSKPILLQNLLGLLLDYFDSMLTAKYFMVLFLPIIYN
jgi:hypothetical protein